MKIMFNAAGLIISSGSFLYTFHVLYNFMHFTSNHNEQYKAMLHEVMENSLALSVIWKLLTNTCLLSLFILQHSLMSNNVIKSIYEKFHIPDLERSIYNAFSAGTLHFVMTNWQPVPWVSLWDVDTMNSYSSWFFFTILHLFGWFVIYSGCVMLDIAELSGLKQVYYKISGRPCPMATKSKEFQRYLAHMRHPSFTGLLIIFWIHPYMTIDRFFLASILTIYMLMMWTIDEEDCHYHATNIYKKRRKLF